MADIFMFTSKNCPSCGLVGKKLKSIPASGRRGVELKQCPACSTVFGEFGVVQEGDRHEHHNKELN